VGHRGGMDILENRKIFVCQEMNHNFSVKPGSDSVTTVPFYANKQQN